MLNNSNIVAYFVSTSVKMAFQQVIEIVTVPVSLRPRLAHQMILDVLNMALVQLGDPLLKGKH